MEYKYIGGIFTSMIKEELEIVIIRELLNKDESNGKLKIPGYQRPYRWSSESALTLLMDTYEAFEKKVKEYRMGSVVLHKQSVQNSTETNIVFNIVDGQQRLTTISIILFAIKERTGEGNDDFVSSLLNEEYSGESRKCIVSNFDIVSRKIKEINSDKLEEYYKYILDSCTVVKIVTEDEQEAFQFFDSQNSRGKELAPHDILKSYHLRLMGDEEEGEKRSIINEWENIKQCDFEVLFANTLYPLTNWYKNRSGLNYSIKKIKVFKGIKTDNCYNFTVYHEAANRYIEEFNNRFYDFISIGTVNQFQLTQPIIAGKGFFEYGLHYEKIKRTIESDIVTPFIKKKNIISEISLSRAGDSYVYNLFLNIIIFFVDRFNIDALTEARMNFLFKWAFSLRLRLKAVYRESVNNYAMGKSKWVNEGKNMFSLIADMQEPIELDTMVLECIKENDRNDKYSNLYEALCAKENKQL